MATIDDKLSSEEDLDNIDYDNQVDVHVDESSSSSLMKNNLQIGKKRGRQIQYEDQDLNDLIESICENECFRRKLIFTNNKQQKNKEVYQNQNLMR